VLERRRLWAALPRYHLPLLFLPFGLPMTREWQQVVEAERLLPGTATWIADLYSGQGQGDFAPFSAIPGTCDK
jgi:hypothetical protein